MLLAEDAKGAPSYSNVSLEMTVLYYCCLYHDMPLPSYHQVHNCLFVHNGQLVLLLECSLCYQSDYIRIQVNFRSQHPQNFHVAVQNFPEK